MGMETEFGFLVYGPDGQRLSNGEWECGLVDFVKRYRPSLRGKAPHDVFLGNGSRLYLDCGHPEWATPEVTSPRDAVRYSRAGESTLLEAATELERSASRLGQAILFKCNVDYAAGTTWGAHENYLVASRHPAELPDQLIPHLASRIVFTGAGGLNPISPGIDFSLSPRVEHLHAVASHRHAIFNTKDEPLAANGCRRLHIVAGESLCSQLGDFLRLGTTALIVKLSDAGFRPGAGISLSQPLEAMRLFAADPSCSARAAGCNGNSISALEIQRHYLGQVESHYRASFMPEWTEEVCLRWRSVLDALERRPTALASVLDWPIKLSLYKQRARHHGIDWDSIPPWSVAQNHLVVTRPPHQCPPRHLDDLVNLLRTAGCCGDVVDALLEQSRSRGLSPPELWESYLALRSELCEIDIRFGQLGSNGVFEAMDRAGVLEHRIVSDEEIAAAIDTPPAAARGRVRGKEIQRLSSSQRRGACDWNRIVDISGSKVIDLSDPFQGDSPQWRKIEREDALADLAHDFFAAPPFMRERHRSRSQADSLYRVVRGRDT
jgi:hypothetical protein